jgi:S-formylglutathione hydrolase FrmB
VTFGVLLPPSYASGDKTYPLFFWLHGGNGNHLMVRQNAPLFEEMWSEGALPEMVVVTPSSPGGQYVDTADGTQRWETFIMKDLLPHLRTNYRVSKEREGTLIGGISMGGFGSLTLGLRHLDTFSAIISFEPYIDPAYTWEDAKKQNMFYLSSDAADAPDDPAYDAAWAANNPATIVRDNADAIRASGIQIYIEVGSEDALRLDLGTNFLHQTLFEHKVRHEYRYVSGADHVGASFDWRIRDGLAFLNRAVNPPPPDPVAEGFREWADGLKKKAGLLE